MGSSLQAAPNDVEMVISSGALLVDINEVSAEQLRDIFEIKEELAQKIVDYRTEAMHLFDFKELLKIEGLSEEMLQRLTSVNDAGPLNKELQMELGLPDNAPVSLQDLLQAAIKEAKLEGLAIVTPLGLWVAGYLPDDLAQDHFLEQIPATLHDLGGDLSKLKLAETQSFSISTDQYDIVIQRAGVLFLLVIQGPDSFDLKTYEKLEKIRREIVRRYRPRFHLFHHAEKTPMDVVFDCPKCDLRIVIHQSASGYEIDCPRCKALGRETSLIVPDKSIVE